MVLLVTNILAPTRTEMYNLLSQNDAYPVKICVEKENSYYRKWNVYKDTQILFDPIILKSISFKQTNWEINLPVNLFRTLRTLKPTTIIVSGYSFSTLIVLCYKFLYGCKMILWCSDTKELRPKGKLRNFVRVFVERRVDAFLVPGTSSRNFYADLSHLSSKLIAKIEYAIDPNMLKPLPSIKFKNVRKEGLLNILIVGYIEDRKGIDLFLNCFSKWLQKGQCYVHIVGDGSKLESYKEQYKSLDNVEWYGFKPYNEIAIYYKSADIFILPTKEDIWGLVVNEAMMFGLPVIVSNNTGCKDDLVDNTNGFVLDLNDFTSCFSFLEGLIGNEERLKAMSDASREKIMKFTNLNSFENIIRLLEIVCSSQKE